MRIELNARAIRAFSMETAVKMARYVLRTNGTPVAPRADKTRFSAPGVLLCLVGQISLCAGADVNDSCDVKQVPIVTPGLPTPNAELTPPSDAIVLFDGRDLTQWRGRDGPARWTVQAGILTVKSGAGDIETRRNFQDFQLHVEWRIASDVRGEGQLRGNSGVYLQGRYEIQVLDSYHNRTYANGEAGAIYGQKAPLVNAMRSPGQWNVYDVIFTAPRFNPDGSLFTPARVTLLQNGVLVQNNSDIVGDTGRMGTPIYLAYSGGPIRLQEHENFGEPVSFRNIWLRELGVSSTSAPTPTAATDGHPHGSLNVDSTVRELLESPAAREILGLCVPEIVPLPLDKIGTRTLRQLQRSINGLTDEKLNLIDERLGEALPRGQD